MSALGEKARTEPKPIQDIMSAVGWGEVEPKTAEHGA